MELGYNNYGINSALFDDKILILIYISIAICIIFIIIALLSLKLLNGIFMKVGRTNLNNNVHNLNSNDENIGSRAITPNHGQHHHHHHNRNNIRVIPNVNQSHEYTDYDFANDVSRPNSTVRNLRYCHPDDTFLHNNLIQETRLGGGSSSGSSQQYPTNQLTLSSQGSHNHYNHLHYYHYPHHTPKLEIRYSNLEGNATNEFAV